MCVYVWCVCVQYVCVFVECMYVAVRRVCVCVCVWLNSASVSPLPSSASRVSAPVLQETAIWTSEVPLPAAAATEGRGPGRGLPAHLEQTLSWPGKPPTLVLPNVPRSSALGGSWVERGLNGGPPTVIHPPVDKGVQQKSGRSPQPWGQTGIPSSRSESQTHTP